MEVVFSGFTATILVPFIFTLIRIVARRGGGDKRGQKERGRKGRGRKGKGGKEKEEGRGKKGREGKTSG